MACEGGEKGENEKAKQALNPWDEKEWETLLNSNLGHFFLQMKGKDR